MDHPKDKAQVDILVSLPPEELEKHAPPSEEEIRRALEQGRADRAAAQTSARPVPSNPRLRYR